MKDDISILKGIHPGFYLTRMLKERGLAKGPFALSINEYPQTLGAITKGKRGMNTSLALKIERALGLEEGYLMTLQIFYEIKKEKHRQQGGRRPDVSRFRRGLFWDTDIDRIDWQRQRRAVIERVFERGNDKEKAEIRRFYGEPVVRKVTDAMKPQHG